MTLIELTAAVAISGFVIATAAALLDQVADGGARISRDAEASLATGNGNRLLDRLTLDAVPSLDTADRFTGDSASAYLRTRCPTSNGWSESCHARLMIDASDDSSTLLLALDGGRQAATRRWHGAAWLRYVDASSAESSWVTRWHSSVTLPSAIAIVSSHDTIVLPIGGGRE